MTDLISIDGDMADFIEAQREFASSYLLSELRQYLANEGHSPDDVEAAMGRWWASWFTGDDDRL